MKILVLHDSSGRIEVLDVEDSIIKNDFQDDVEWFLTEKGYSVNNITWMAGYSDFIPVVFHKYELDEKGNLTHNCRESRLNDYSIDEEYTLTKGREIDELYEAVMQHGTLAENGNKEVVISEDYRPLVAGYINDDPSDILVKKAIINANHKLKIVGCDKEGYTEDQYFDPDDIFKGHLTFITSVIGM